ncbi:MAG TPA: AAA family ATPase [Ktedonobacteraceae bacterium]|nr:AAA family ATPase [Ktedonobacteraceae bacterium]
MRALVSVSRMSTTHATSEVMHSSAGLAALLPPGWSLDFPLARVRTCGALTVEVLQDLHPGPGGHVQAVYGPPAVELFHIKGMTTAFLLLALLASQPGGFASRDLLTQTLPHLRRGNAPNEEDDLEEDSSLARLDNVVSLLRKLLCPPKLLTFPGTHKLRKRMVSLVRATPDSGPGYRLAEFPLLWLDVEAMEHYIVHARQLEEHGEDGLEDWQAAYQIGMRGPFLSHEPYSEWADWRRGRVSELLWQSVNAQCHRAASWEAGTSGIEAAVRLLLEFWQAQVTNEDAFRALVDLLGKQERFQLAEECYCQLCAVLDREGRVPHPRTQEAMEVLRATRLRREVRRPQPALASPSSGSRGVEGTDAHSDEETSQEGPYEGLAERIIAETRHLLGREAWLAAVRQMVQAFPAKKLIVLQGPIGIGKSSELTRLASQFQRDQGSFHVIWLPFSAAERTSGPEVALDVLLATLLSACGVAPMPSEVPRERLMAAFLASLKQHSRPLVILLDNAECLLDEQGMLAPCWEAFLTQFVRSRHQASLLLATKEWHGWPGRESVFVAETVVPPLSTDESVRLLQHLGLEELSVEQLQAVGMRMAGIPLLLEWTAKLVADPLLLNDWSGFDERDGLLHAHTTQESRARRLQRLLDDPALLGAHLAARLTPLLEYIMETHLSPEARHVLERLAVATIPLGKAALQVLCPRPALLKELRDASLLAAYTNRVQVLPMVAETVRQQLTAEQRREAEDLVIQAYIAWREQGIEDDQEKAAVVAELIIFDLNRLRLLDAMELFLQMSGLLDRFGHAARIAHLAFHLLEQAQLHTSLEQEYGGILLRSCLAPALGQKSTASMRAQAYQPIYAALISGQVHLQMSTELYVVQQLMLAECHALRFAEAQDILDQAFARHPDLEQTDLRDFASLLARRADLLSTWSDYAQEQQEDEQARTLREQAIALYHQCIRLWKRVEEQSPPGKRSSYRYNQARYLNSVAYRLRQQGMFDEALAVIEQGIALEEAGYTKPGSLATAYSEKAQILAAQGRFREALQVDAIAVEQMQRDAAASENSTLQSEVWTLLAERGQIYLRVGKLKEAESLFEEASHHISDSRRSYRIQAEEGLAEIRQWRQVSPREQLDWRWSVHYQELVQYDANRWLTPAAFSPAEWETWTQVQGQSSSEEDQQRLEVLMAESRDREILAALSEGREPRLQYPRIPIAEVMQRIEGLRTLAEEIARDEPNVVVRRLYLDVIEENLFLLQLIQATHERNTWAFWQNTRALHAEPPPEEMERALSQVGRLIALGRARADLVEVSEVVWQFLQRVHAPVPILSAPAQVREAQEDLSEAAASPRMVAPQTAQRFFDAVMRDYGFDGWHTVIDAAATDPYVESFTQRLTLQDRQLSLERIRYLLSHEIECHVFRAAMGAKSPVALLGTGTAFYRLTEEGLAKYYDHQTEEVQGKVEDEFLTGSYIGTLATGLACGVLISRPLTFSQLYQFLESFLVLQRVVTGMSKYVEKARANVPRLARARCLRTFQGVPDLSAAGVAYTQDALYHRGLQLVERAIQMDAQVLTRLMVGKVGLQQLDDLAELGITEPANQPRWLAHDPDLDQYILSFESQSDGTHAS